MKTRPANPAVSTHAAKTAKTQPARRAESQPVSRAQFIVAPIFTSIAGDSDVPDAGLAPRHVRIGYFNPFARDVHVAGSFNHWDPAAMPLVRDEFGDWCGELDLPPGEYRYRFVVDGEWREDPAAVQNVRNSCGGFDALLYV